MLHSNIYISMRQANKFCQKMQHKKYIYLILLLLELLAVCAVQGDTIEDSWVEPNAWDREKHRIWSGLDFDEKDFLFPKCDVGATTTTTMTEDAIALMYYKKFIAILFNRQKLKFDKKTGLFERSVLFTIQPTELNKLETLSDPRDLDTVLTDIFTKARLPYKCKNPAVGEGSSIFALIWDIFKDLNQLLKISEVHFTLIALAAILFGWWIHRRYHIHIIVIIICGFLLFGYFMTYFECNRKLEVERMFEALENNEANKPSKEYWYSPITNLFWPESQTIQLSRAEKIKKSSKLQLAYCRPDYVFVIYANELTLKQLEFLLEKCIDTFMTLNKSLWFPFNIVAPVSLIALIAYIIKLTFKYILSPRAWASLLHHPRNTSTKHEQQRSISSSPSTAAIALGDRVLGDNLKLVLNAVSLPQIVLKSALSVSGVQEVLGQLEDMPSALYSESSSAIKENEEDGEQQVNDKIGETPSTSSSNTPNSSFEKRNSNEEPIKAKANEVKIEDVSVDT